LSNNYQTSPKKLATGHHATLFPPTIIVKAKSSIISTGILLHVKPTLKFTWIQVLIDFIPSNFASEQTEAIFVEQKLELSRFLKV
jgi:hypothetical protein